MSAGAAVVRAPVIELTGIHKSYDTGSLEVHALRGVDLRIERGEMVAIMGPSGSGKTTLMEVLGCLSRPSAGRYRLDGRSVDEIDAEMTALTTGRAGGRAERLTAVLQALEREAAPGLTAHLAATLGDEAASDDAKDD